MTAEWLTGYEPAGAAEGIAVQRVRGLLAADGDAWSRSTPLHLTASALVLHPPTRRVLLRWHQRQGCWLQVGGHGDPGESDPLAIALREAAEETGLPDLVPWPDGRLRHVVICSVRASTVKSSTVKSSTVRAGTVNAGTVSGSTVSAGTVSGGTVSAGTAWAGTASAGAGEPAHEHADLRYLFATQSPDAIRPEDEGAPLRWVTLPEARELVGDNNITVTLDRAEKVLAAAVAAGERRPS